jgi:gliding motility-associated-like protein
VTLAYPLVFEQMKKALLFILTSIFYQCATAQETEWMFGFNGNNTGFSTVCNDNEGNTILANSTVQGSGSFQYRGATIETGNNINNLILTKVSPDDSLFWIFSTKLNSGERIYPLDIVVDENNDIYVLVRYSPNLTIQGSVKLESNFTGFRVGIIKFSKDGVPLWARQYGPNASININSLVSNRFSYTNKKLFIVHEISASFVYEGNSQVVNSTNSKNYAIACYDSGGNFNFVKVYGSVNMFRTETKSINNDIYFTATFDKDYIVNSDTLFSGNHLIKLDSLGNLKNHILISTNFTPILPGIKFDIDNISQSIYLTFSFIDSFEINSNKVFAKNSSTTFQKYSMCVMKLHFDSSNLIWCNCQDSSSLGYLSTNVDLIFNNNNLYMSGDLTGNDVLLGSTLFKYETTAFKNIFIVKFDTLGNILWGFTEGRSGSFPYLRDMTVDNAGNLYLTGNFNNKIKIFNDSLINTNVQETFLAKITDYSITRGDVFAGPYCAGDSILIPYTRMGPFEPDNEFIAELSDENGNFEGGQRELGRLKTTEDSTIIGALPLFEVSSSANYRIRIRSTHPPVQSFFRRDSLRLLIYSRDKADPGPPETVCFGDSFRLNTFGGTAWEWSPAYRMDNPNARSPLIYPDRDTLFRIIISDSSGCGEPDTAFKQIFIRPKVQIQTQNVVNACWGSPVNLTANFTQGDSSQYRWTWFNSDSSLWAPLQSDSFRTKDTFTFNYPQSNDTIRFALVLQDDCQTLKDTALITVRLSPHRISSILSTQDSIICYQSHQNLIANLSGGDSATYQWQWFEVDTSGGFSVMKQDSLRFSDTLQVQLRTESKDFQRYALVSNDNCIPFFDTAYLHVNINPHRPQVDVLPSDTFVCPLTPVPLQGQLNNGSELGYAFTWLDEANHIQQTDTGFAPALFVPSPDFSGGLMQRVYRLVAQDLCSPYGDTAEVLVNINQHQPLADILPSDTSVCPLTPVLLQGQVNSGSVLGYAFTWLDETNNIQQTDTGFAPALFVPSPDFSGGLMQRVYRLVAQDLCSPNADTAQTRISPREPLQAIPNTFDTTVCSGTELSLSASGLGGDSSNYQYQWILNDNIISSDSDVGFIPPINHSPFTIQLVLTDNCMPQNDTAEVVVRVRPALRSAILREPHLNIAVQDTTVCSGSELRFFAKALGGDSTHYSFEWLWNDSLMGTDSDVMVRLSNHHHSPSTLHLISKDGCTVPNDTTSVTINILPPLSVTLRHSKGDTLCAGEESVFFAQATGGDSTNYSFEWLLNDSLIGTDSNVMVRLSNHHPSPSTLQLILSDGCSSPNDTFTHTFIIRPSLAIDLAASTLCANPTTTLTANPSGGNPDNYVIQWFDEAENMLGEGLSIEVTPSQLTTYKAILTDGCSADSASTQIQIDLIPSILELTASPTEGCEPLEMEFEINTNYQDSFSGIIFISDTDSIELSNLFGRIGRMAIRPHGIYTPSFQFISKLGCTGISQNTPTITVHPKPTAAFSFSPEEPDLDNNSVQFRNLSTGANSYVWNISPFGVSTEFEPQYNYTDSGFHPLQLIAISDQDCKDTAQGQVYIRTNYRVYIPNAFSPNGDGLNDVFQPSMRGFSESDFKIFNRWGELIYQSRDNTGWDGTYRGQPVQEGVYMYTLSVLNLFGERQFFNGTVVLMR